MCIYFCVNVVFFDVIKYFLYQYVWGGTCIQTGLSLYMVIINIMNKLIIT